MGALCTEVAGVLEAVATAEDDEDEEPGPSPATAPTRFALAVKASREAAADAGLAAPTTCAPTGCSPCDQSCINPARVLQSTPCVEGSCKAPDLGSHLPLAPWLQDVLHFYPDPNLLDPIAVGLVLPEVIYLVRRL